MITIFTRLVNQYNIKRKGNIIRLLERIYFILIKMETNSHIIVSIINNIKL